MKDVIGQNGIGWIEPAIANLARQLGIDICGRRPCDNGRLGMLGARLFVAGLAGCHDKGRQRGYRDPVGPRFFEPVHRADLPTLATTLTGTVLAQHSSDRQSRFVA